MPAPLSPELRAGFAAVFADNCIALNAVEGLCRVTSNTLLVHLGRQLWFACPVRSVGPYVPAHRGVQPNALADLLAELGRRGGQLYDYEPWVLCEPVQAEESVAGAAEGIAEAGRLAVLGRCAPWCRFFGGCGNGGRPLGQQ